MKISDAAEKLSEMYNRAPEGGSVIQIHLFGIKYAEQLKGKSLKELVALAGLPKSYHTEIRKGMNLAPFVSLR